MINEFKIAKALRTFLKSKTALTVVSDDSGYKPTPTDSYVKEKVMLGNVDITMGSGSENANGIYQVDVITPIARKRWLGMQTRDALKAHFTKGLSANIEDGGQKVIINNVNTPPMRINEAQTHLIHTLDINFRVIS